MELIPLGKTGLNVTRPAFGALPLQRLERGEAVGLLRAATDGGVNFFDTARAYTDSESKIGDAFEGMRGRVLIATKTRGANRAAIESDLIKSLEALKTDYLDLYQFHNIRELPRPDDGTQRWETMSELKRKGVVRAVGITSHSLETAGEAAASGLYDTVQFPFSLLATGEEEKLVRLCREKNIGFIAMKALAGGLITNIPAAFAYLQSFSNAVPIWGMQTKGELAQFLQLAASPPVPDADMGKAIQAEREALGGRFCRGCGYCLPCPQGIYIPFVARLDRLLRRSPWRQYAEKDWVERMRAAKTCLLCGDCAARCPYGLNPGELVAANVADYENFMREQGLPDLL
ncbi:MAG: aldo/keto reductase [Desulfovibrio sp.]|jgi:aryl-alcohol dehydrogenase-like predicted oxidoreductase|nr:aldo/keto reductase [Desulfovibrio sp.]